MILTALGILMPFSDDVAFFLFYLAATAAQVVLLYFCSNKVEVTYAKFYDALRTPPVELAVNEE
jgi:predicted transposase YdaD